MTARYCWLMSLKVGSERTTRRFWGALVVAKLQLAAMSRIDVAQNDRRDFYLYVDEFSSFVSNDSFSGILSEARKYRLCLTLSHQYIEQLDEKLRYTVFGNVGTVLAFPLGPEDAEFFERQFYPEFKRKDLTGLAHHRIYLRLAIDGKTSRAFSASTLRPFSGRRRQGMIDKIIGSSRLRYAVKRPGEILLRDEPQGRLL